MLKDLKRLWKNIEKVMEWWICTKTKERSVKKCIKKICQNELLNWHFNSLIVTKKKTEKLWKSVTLNLPYFGRIDSGRLRQGTEKSTTINFEKKCNKKRFGLVFKIQWQGFVTNWYFLPKLLALQDCQKLGKTKCCIWTWFERKEKNI